MGIKRFFKNKIKNRQFIKNKKVIKINHFPLEYFNNYYFDFNLDSKTQPEVSIVIPVYNQIRYTLNCLLTINEFDKEISKEVIIVNDNSSDETLKYITKISGIKIINNKENIGFLRSVNLGIKEAKGKYIYLLNNDVEVQESYLSSLLEVFNNEKNVGAVGSKMIFKNNTLQEAGNLIFKDSEIITLGRYNSIEHPTFNFLRKVDYCSGCSLLFKRLDNAGNVNILDEVFSPAYYEETDLCQRLKFEQNLNIYYQPFSEILHFENISYTEKNNNKEKLLEKNRKVFQDRWNSFFRKEVYIDDKRRINLNLHFTGPSFLFLEENMPKPDQDSGSRRFLEILKILKNNNHRIILAVKHYDSNTDLRYVDFFRKFGVEVCLDYVSSKNKIVNVKEQVLEALNYVDIVWIFRPIGFDFWYNMIEKHITKQKIVYDMVDLHYLRLERENEYVEVTKSRIKEIQYFKDKEYFGMNNADAVISISDKEKNIVSENGVDINKIFTLSNIHQPSHHKNIDFNEREGLLFIGGYHHLPNIDAVKFLHDEIMSLVWKKEPNIKVYILGPDFPDDLKTQYQSERFVILGYQPEVDYWFENARVFVAPLRYGAGVKGKIGQALEFKIPVVTTEIGAEGMFLEDYGTAIISSLNPKDFADKIIHLYKNEDLWRKLNENSHKPLSKFSVEEQELNLKEMLKYLEI